MRASLLLILFGSLLGGPALAAWEKIGESEIGDVFIDKASIKRNGTNIRVNTLISPSQQPPSTRNRFPVSFERQVEVICKTLDLKVISGVSYTGIMSTGAVFSREEVGRFAKVVPGTTMGRIAEAACQSAPGGK